MTCTSQYLPDASSASSAPGAFQMAPCGVSCWGHNTDWIDLHGFAGYLDQGLTDFFEIHKMHVQKIQGHHFLKNKKLCGTLHTIAKGLVPLFAANHSATCHHLPLAIPLFAAICH